jgi:hypothetical protein
VDATQLPVLDVQLLAATAPAPRVHDLRRLSRHKFTLNCVDERLGFIQAQTDIARLQIVRIAADDKHTVGAGLGRCIRKLERH